MRSSERRKYLNLVKIQTQLLSKEISIFTKIEFARIFKVEKGTVNIILQFLKRAGVIASIKRGLYYTVANPPSAFEIANVLYQPSYISLETALSYHRILPESVYSVISLTPKHTKRFLKLNREFVFRKINKFLFFGYKSDFVGGKKVLMAEKEKAFLDYVYFVARGLKRMNERFDISRLDKEKLINHLGYYQKHLKGKKFKVFHSILNKYL